METLAPMLRRWWSAYWRLPTVLLVVLTGCATSAVSEATEGAERCADSEFTCVGLEVPLDHFNSDDGRTMDVTFAVLPSSGDSRGAYVTAVGGPGESGLMVADLVLSTFDPEVREHYDIVFFEQRGLAVSTLLACPGTEATTNLYLESLEEVVGEWAATVKLYADYVEACLAEMGNPEILAYLGTDQAAEDIEAFRRWGGYERLVLHGESYGTALVQTYAARYPETVERMILDGVIDLTLDKLSHRQAQIEAFEGGLEMLFEACDLDPDCAADMRIETRHAYRELERWLELGPIVVDYLFADGEWREVFFYVEDLWALAYSSLYTEDDRMLFLRALAAYSGRNDLLPLVRLYLSGSGSELSWVFNTAVNCADASLPGYSPAKAVQAIAEAWETYWYPGHRNFFLSDLTCAVWPHTDHTRTPSDSDQTHDIPTLILATRADPATPYSQAEAVAGRLENGHLLSQEGGPHVIFGWGNECVDSAVTRFIIQSETPEMSECPGPVIGPYLPLLPTTITELQADEMLPMIEAELLNLPEAQAWDVLDVMLVGCGNGGEITIAGSPEVGLMRLLDCELLRGFTVNGTGEWNHETRSTTLDLTVPETGCRYHWESNWDDESAVVRESCG